jgi:hypothetical protein
MADTQQSVNNPQTAGGNLQPNRSDLQPLSSQNQLLSQGGVDQQKLPITTRPLTVQTTEPGSSLPPEITPDAALPGTSLTPFLVALCFVALFIIALAAWAMRPRPEVVPEKVTPTATPKPKSKKAASKPKPKKKKSKKRS